MTHVTCRLTAKNRDQLRNPTLGTRVRVTFTFLGPMRVCNPNDTSIGLAGCAGLTAVPNTRTDTETTERATRVAMDRIYATHAMRPKTDGSSSTMDIEYRLRGRKVRRTVRKMARQQDAPV